MCADVLLWKTVLSKNGRREWIKKEYKGKEMGRLTKEGIEGGVGGRGGGEERERWEGIRTTNMMSPDGVATSDLSKLFLLSEHSINALAELYIITN